MNKFQEKINNCELCNKDTNHKVFMDNLNITLICNVCYKQSMLKYE